MGRRIAEFDWSSTAIGPIAKWTPSFVNIVKNLLVSPAPFLLLLGKEGIKIYNDAYIAIAGNRHPLSLGKSVFEVWPEAQTFLHHIFQETFEGKSLSYKNLPFTVYRNDNPEERWFDLHYSPLYIEDSHVAGVLAVMFETTSQVQSELRLNLALEAARDGIWEWDFKNDLAWWDERYSSIIGIDIPQNERTLASAGRYIHPDDKGLIEEKLKDHLEFGKEFEVEYRIVLPSREIKFLRALGKAQKDLAGNMVKLTGTLRDITESKKAELALKENEERYALVMDAINDGIWDYNVAQENSFWNDRFYEIIGYYRGEIERPSFEFVQTIIHPEDLQKVQSEFTKVLHGEAAYDVEYRLRHKAGHYVYVHSKGKPVFNKDNALIRLVGVIRDISARKKAEEENQKLVAIIEATPDYVSLANTDGQLRYVNEAGRRMVGIDSIENRSILDNIYHEDLELAEKILLPQLFTKGSFSQELRFRNEKTGEPIWIKWKGLTVKDKNGKIIALATICPDITKRKLAEQELEDARKTSDQLAAERSAILNQLSEGVIVTDTSGKIIFVNEAAATLHGVATLNTTPEEYTETYQLYTEEGLPYPFEKLPLSRAVLNGEIVLNEHWRIHRPDGTTILAIGSARPVIGLDNEKIGYVLTLRDDTERRLAEQTVRQSEGKFRQLANTLPIVVWTASPDGNLTFISRQWEDSFGNKISESLGNEWVKFVHPDDVITAGSAWAYSLKTGVLYETEFRVQHKSGSYRWLLVRALPIKDDNGNIIMWYGSNTDIDDKKSSEEALKESEERFRNLADQLPHFIWMINAEELKVTYANKTFLDFLGLQKTEDFLGTIWQSFIHPGDLALANTRYKEAVESKSSYELECRFLESSTNQYRWFMIKGVPRFEANNQLAGYIGSAVDIHMQKTMHEQMELKNNQLVRTNNDLDNFIYTASHDLKAPMSNIEGLLHSLRDTLQAEQSITSDTDLILELMENSVLRFKNTILDLTEISKVQKDAEEDQKEINLRELLEDVRVSIHDQISNSKAFIEADFLRAPFIVFSRKNLKSIIYNLVSNAIKYRDPTRYPYITISSEPLEDFVLITIKDNGLGIGEKNLDKVFSMFKRFHDHVEGTGIGLYIVKRIIDNAGGKIELESKVGEGSTFKIWLRK